MRFIAKLATVVLGLAFSVSSSAGIFVGGGGMGRTVDLKCTSVLLEKVELKQFTLLPDSAKITGKETDLPEDLKFVPDEEFVELKEATTVQLTDEEGNVLKTYDVQKLDETSGTLVFIEKLPTEDAE